LPRTPAQYESSEHDRSDGVGVRCAHHHDLPAGLAVANQTGLALGIGVSLDNLLDKPGFGLANILDLLTGHGRRQKAHEIARMTGLKRNPDLAVMLHAADPGAVAGARIEHDERPLARRDGGPLRRHNAHQPVIHRPRERPAIQHELGVESQHIRDFAGIVLEIVVAPLAQHVQQENGALPRVNPVFEEVVRSGQRRQR
jgi:hypothetical protein